MASEADGLASVVGIRADSIKDLFASLSQRQFPQAYLFDVASFPIKVADHVTAQLPSLTIGASSPAKERQIRRYGMLLEQIHLVAEFLEAADVLAIPAQISTYLDETIKRLLPDANLVLRADTEFNYSFEPLASAINEAIPPGVPAALPGPLGLFRLPYASKDDALLHVILAHEAGHLFDEYEKLIRSILGQASSVVDSARTQIASGVPLDLTLTGDVAQLNRAMTTLYSWLGELVSDLVGVHLLGPAFALASLEFNGFDDDPAQGSPTHPPTLIRLKLIEDELGYLGWMDEVLLKRGLWKPVPAFTPKAIGTHWPLDAKIVELVAANIIPFLSTCAAVVRAFFNDRSFKPEPYLLAEEHLLSCLGH